jgi:hypothetical protein
MCSLLEKSCFTSFSWWDVKSEGCDTRLHRLFFPRVTWQWIFHFFVVSGYRLEGQTSCVQLKLFFFQHKAQFDDYWSTSRYYMIYNI